MIIDSGKRAFTHVLVYQLDRFARDRYDSATYKHVLKKNGVKVLSAKENITDDASSVLMESVLEGMAEYYSKELAQKVKRGMEMSAKKGKYIGGSRVFGFNIIEDKTFVINEEEAKWVRIVFDMYSNRTTLEDISKYLNDQHVKTNNGKRWEYKHINRMISNRKYIGEYTYKGEVNKDCIPSIVSRESWDRAQALKKQRKHKAISFKFDVPYHLSGKLICAECGGPIAGAAGSGCTQKYHYYRCNNKIRNGKMCDLPYFRKDILEEKIVKFAKGLFTDDFINNVVDEAINIVEKENVSKERIKSIDKEIKETKSQIDKFTDLLITQSRNIDIIMDKIDTLKNKINDLNNELVTIEMHQKKIDREDLIKHMIKIRDFEFSKPENIQMFIDSCIDYIFLFKNKKIAVLFKLSDGNISRDSSRIRQLVELMKSETCTSLVLSKHSIELIVLA